MIGNRGDAVREMLAARLQSFEDMFNHGGAELAERIARDSTTLGNLITRHLGEFDRTVKTYGGEMVERLGERTQDISGAMRDYLDNFDTRVTTKSAEVTASLDQQFIRFHDALDGRTQTLNEALGSPRHGHRQDDGRRRQGGGRRARQAHRRRHRRDQRARRQAGRDASAPRSTTSTRRWACARMEVAEQPRHPHRPLRGVAARPRRQR